jgi:hypothetical protein
MEYLIYFATILSCLGNVFIILRNKIGFWIWILGNIVWIYVDWYTPNMKPQIIMMVVYFILNVWGLIEWNKGLNIFNPLWEIKENGKCYDCKFKGRVFRLVKAVNYDRINDKHPQFRCSECSGKKIQQLLEKGVIL